MAGRPLSMQTISRFTTSPLVMLWYSVVVPCVTAKAGEGCSQTTLHGKVENRWCTERQYQHQPLTVVTASSSTSDRWLHCTCSCPTNPISTTSALRGASATVYSMTRRVFAAHVLPLSDATNLKRTMPQTQSQHMLQPAVPTTRCVQLSVCTTKAKQTKRSSTKRCSASKRSEGPCCTLGAHYDSSPACCVTDCLSWPDPAQWTGTMP